MVVERHIEGRSSLGFAWHPYRREISRAPRKEPSADELRALVRAAADVAVASDADDSSRAHHLRAQFDLLRGNGMRARKELESVLAQDPSNAAARNDLAVALLSLSGSEGHPRYLVDALEAIEGAERSLKAAETRFNAVVILSRLGLCQAANAELNAAVPLEAKAEWREEMRKRVADDCSNSPVDWSDQGAAESRGLEELVKANPQAARERVLEELLPLWGDSTLAGRRSESQRLLASVRQLANALHAVHGETAGTGCGERDRRGRRWFWGSRTGAGTRRLPAWTEGSERESHRRSDSTSRASGARLRGLEEPDGGLVQALAKRRAASAVALRRLAKLPECDLGQAVWRVIRASGLLRMVCSASTSSGRVASRRRSSTIAGAGGVSRRPGSSRIWAAFTP
jgi:hypothetical protein